MKKYLLSVLLISSFSLVACTSNNNEEVSAQSTEQPTTETTEEEPESTFKDGVFDNDSFTLTYEDAKIINSPMENSPGLYVTYTLKNKLEENINPQEVLDLIVTATQENDTSEVDLSNDYYSTDAFGPEDDVDTYNEQVDKENAVSNDLKPGKEVEIINAFGLDNKEEPVQLQMLVNPETEEYSDPYEIKLDKLEELPEPTSKPEEETTAPNKEIEGNEEMIESENNEEAESVQEGQGYWDDGPVNARWHEAKEKGLNDEEAYDYANGTNTANGEAPDEGVELEDSEYYDCGDEEDYEVIEDEEISEEEAQANIEQVEQFREDFKAEHRREPTSGEIQSQW